MYILHRFKGRYTFHMNYPDLGNFIIIQYVYSVGWENFGLLITVEPSQSCFRTPSNCMFFPIVPCIFYVVRPDNVLTSN